MILKQEPSRGILGPAGRRVPWPVMAVFVLVWFGWVCLIADRLNRMAGCPVDYNQCSPFIGRGEAADAAR